VQQWSVPVDDQRAVPCQVPTKTLEQLVIASCGVKS
jgi:hypothetical protein